MYHLLRSTLYSFLFAAAVVELGLTAYRVHFTKNSFHSYEPIVVELLVTSCLAILIAPFNIFFAISGSDSNEEGTVSPTTFTTENILNFIIWVMFFVGGAMLTHRYANPFLAGPFKQGHILLTIVAFAWICFSTITFAYVVSLMHFADRRARYSLRGGSSTIKA